MTFNLIDNTLVWQDSILIVLQSINKYTIIVCILFIMKVMLLFYIHTI